MTCFTEVDLVATGVHDRPHVEHICASDEPTPDGPVAAWSAVNDAGVTMSDYLGEPSPLAEALARYADFFALFDDFTGSVGFFLLHDLVGDDGAVQFYMHFDDFPPPSVPKDIETYREYRRRSTDFTTARNRRIDRYSASTPA